MLEKLAQLFSSTRLKKLGQMPFEIKSHFLFTFGARNNCCCMRQTN
jgi:hypothetical protein